MNGTSCDDTDGDDDDISEGFVHRSVNGTSCDDEDDDDDDEDISKRVPFTDV